MRQVAQFCSCIRELLAYALPTDESGSLSPAVLDLSPQARAEWIRLHDDIERALGARGEWRAVRDVAAKAAENAARMAALFHVLEHGPTGTIAYRRSRPTGVQGMPSSSRRRKVDSDICRAAQLEADLRKFLTASGTAAASSAGSDPALTDVITLYVQHADTLRWSAPRAASSGPGSRQKCPG